MLVSIYDFMTWLAIATEQREDTEPGTKDTLLKGLLLLKGNPIVMPKVFGQIVIYVYFHQILKYYIHIPSRSTRKASEEIESMNLVRPSAEKITFMIKKILKPGQKAKDEEVADPSAYEQPPRSRAEQLLRLLLLLTSAAISYHNKRSSISIKFNMSLLAQWDVAQRQGHLANKVRVLLLLSSALRRSRHHHHHHHHSRKKRMWP